MKQEFQYLDVSILKVTDVSLKLMGQNAETGKPEEKLILRDINLEIKDVVRPGKTTGQVIGFLGPSGRGKTQLFNVMSGLRKPTTGEVLVHGKPVNPGDVGVVAQNYPLFQHCTVLKNLQLGANKNKKMTPAERKEKIEFYLERFKMIDKMNVYPAQLSGGQKQRIAIIQQLLCSEGFLLMDEPFSGLDVNMTTEVCEVISEVANLDDLNTIVVVSHDYHSTAAISNNLWFLGYDYEEIDGKKVIIPGAHIKFQEDMMERGFAWRFPEIMDDPEFGQFTRDVRRVFHNL